MTSLDPRFHPTPVEPDYKVDHLWAEFLDENEDIAVSTELVYEWHWGPFMVLIVRMLDGFQYDKEQAENLIRWHFGVMNVEFEYL